MISQAGKFVTRLAILAAMAATVGCSSSPPVRDSVADRAVSVALQQLGAPYRYGGKSPSGFDCSGLAHYSYASAGLDIPRTTAGQWAELEPISRFDVRAGDLLFFRFEGKMSHVGLYIGDGRFVHAPSSGKHVSVDSLDSNLYGKALIRAGRP